MKLTWHNYRYYPYERELARRESAAVLPGVQMRESVGGLDLAGSFDTDSIRHLAYFSGLKKGQSFLPTKQHLLEATARSGKNRQSTRYSTHGLHEYKGKFNPQVAKSLLNIFKVSPGDNVVDPFCGSGTTLVECAHMGVHGFGTDLNPLAVYIANAKLLALTTPVAQLRSVMARVEDRLRSAKNRRTCLSDNHRSRYLARWFDLPILHTIEITRGCIEAEAGSLAPIFLVIASNLLRDYSQQDPRDLRIRRRKSPIPETPFVGAFVCSAEQAFTRLDDVQSEIDTCELVSGMAAHYDTTVLTSQDIPVSFDAAITSPPYAMALPYIDTHRLSLVWLDLLDARRIPELDAKLVGSREIRGEARHKAIYDREFNAAGLPDQEAEFCSILQRALGSSDGFRRKSVPYLLYRYFTDMRNSFAEIRKVMKPGAPLGLIIGGNHSVLGGVRYEINTPAHLASLAKSVGWGLVESMPLQTYQRYGYHMNNAISSESLVILKA